MATPTAKMSALRILFVHMTMSTSSSGNEESLQAAGTNRRLRHALHHVVHGSSMGAHNPKAAVHTARQGSGARGSGRAPGGHAYKVVLRHCSGRCRRTVVQPAHVCCTDRA